MGDGPHARSALGFASLLNGAAVGQPVRDTGVEQGAVRRGTLTVWKRFVRGFARHV